MVHWKVREKGPWDRTRGLAQDKQPLPITPLVASLTETLRVQERRVKMPAWEERKEWACSREGGHMPNVLSFDASAEMPQLQEKSHLTFFYTALVLNICFHNG